MALFNTLLNLKEKGLMLRFDMNGEDKGVITLLNREYVNVFMSTEYIVGITEIREAFLREPYPDYIIYNAWDKVTDSAREEAKRNHVPVVSFSQFRYMLENRNVRSR